MKALVVGGGRGIGRAIGEALAKNGDEVGLIARTGDEVEAAAWALRDLGAKATGIVADVLDRSAVRSAVARFVGGGGLDAVVFAAGRFRGIGPIAAVDPDAWWLDVETTLRGFALVARETLPTLRQSPSPSLVALIGPGHAGELAFGTGYGAAQAGLARLVESLAVELKPEGVVVYAVNPGVVPTALLAPILDEPEGRRWLPRFTEALAEGKEVGPEVAAEMVAWLVHERPLGLSGRVVSALLAPEILRGRIERIAADDLGKLRLR